jgi:glyoxylase-like metal-dependent hydrolase (beta-lactamase superfamily II)
MLALSMTLGGQAPVRSIDRLAGDIYQFRNGGHYGTFLVTPAGIVLIDPISADASTWLKEQLAGRFPGRPVRIIVYSHHDGDHSGGAEVFKDTVSEIVAHENAPAGIAADPRVHVMPTRTFNGTTTVTLGGETIELIELGPGHTNNLIGIRFPREQVLFVVDLFSGKRLPFNGLAGETDVDTLIGGLRRLEAMDFRILATGHSAPSNIAELVGYRTFLENLRAQVLQARREGRTVDDMKRTITMPGYRDWTNYELWLAPSIENMNRYLERIGAK